MVSIRNFTQIVHLHDAVIERNVLTLSGYTEHVHHSKDKVVTA